MWFFVAIVVFLGADLIKAPSTVPSDHGSIVVSAKKGGRRWRADWTMEPYTRDGRKAVRFTEHGEGHISPFSQEVRWTIEAVWSADPGFQPLDTEKTVTTPTGTLLASERKHFDPAKGTVHFERQYANKRPEIKELSITPDVLAVEGIAGVLRFIPFDRDFLAYVLSNEPRLYHVTFENRGKERVRTPAGEFEAYKIEMVPHLGLLNVVRSFAPKTFFWFTVAAPHFWVRYEGPENGLGTPEIVMELDTTQR